MDWISQFSVPSDISSDRGARFTSKLWSDIAELFGTKLHRTTAYHPQANGLVERFHRHMKSALHALLTTAAWMDELPWVMLGIRTAPKENLNPSSAEMVFGAPPYSSSRFLGSAGTATNTWSTPTTAASHNASFHTNSNLQTQPCHTLCAPRSQGSPVCVHTTRSTQRPPTGTLHGPLQGD